MATAIVTGASMGLGQALARGLARSGWALVIDARGEPALEAAAAKIRAELAPDRRVVAIAGDVKEPAHRATLVAAARELGGLELIVNNASDLGAAPLPPLERYPLQRLLSVLDTNVVAPLGLVQAAAPLLDAAVRPRVLNVTSDASVEAYPGWGGYGASKAALDHASAVLAAEKPSWRVWAVDPGDLRTRMHQDAFPGEDISDRPEPESAVPGLLSLIESDRSSGRVRLAEILSAATGS